MKSFCIQRFTLGSILFFVVFLGESVRAQGFPNVPQTPGALLSGLMAPDQGRSAILAYHNGELYTIPELPGSLPGSDFQVRRWDISSPTAPVELEQLGESTHPFMAHGFIKSGDYLVIGPNWPPENPWTFRADGANTVRTQFPDFTGFSQRGDLYSPWFATSFLSYSMVGGNAEIQKDGVTLASWDHLGETGVIAHPFILGNLLIYASDQSRTGTAIYDISDPSNPRLLDVDKTGGVGGYWAELWAGNGKLYVVYPYRTDGNGIRVVDITDPTNIQFVADVPLSGDECMYLQFQDEFAFVGNHKVDMRSLQSVLDFDSRNVVRADGGIGVDMSQAALPLGNLLVSGGMNQNQGTAIWAHQAAPDTRGPEVSYHVPRDGQVNYPVGAPISLIIHETLETPTIVNGTSFIVRPVGGGATVPGRLTFSSGDVLTFTPDSDFAENTSYEVILPEGGIEDAAGNGMSGYSFTFSTGSIAGGNQAPSIQSFSHAGGAVATGASVTFSVAATDPESDPIEVRFDFGDGTDPTAWSPATTAVHSFTTAGHYSPTVQVRDDSGALSTRAFVITVVDGPTVPATTLSSSSRPLALDEDNRRIWTVNPDNDTVTVIDADSLAFLHEIPTGARPSSVAISPTGEAWVTCRESDRIDICNVNGTRTATIPLDYGDSPYGIVFSPDGSTAYVSLYGAGELARISVAGSTVISRLAVGATPRALAINSGGSQVFVGRFISPVHVGEVRAVETAGFTVSHLYDIAKVRDSDDSATGKGVPNYLSSLTLTPDDAYLFITAKKDNIDRGTLTGADLDSDNSVRNILIRLDLSNTNPETNRELVDIDNSEQASSVAFSPLGDYLFVTLQGNNEVAVFDYLAWDNRVSLGAFVTRASVGSAPQGVIVDPVTNRILVKNFTGREISVLDGNTFFGTGSIQFPNSSVATVASEALTAEALLGKQLFYHAGPRMSAEGYISCATCHSDGGHDGQTWDFTGRGEGLRNTSDLRGRSGTGHGNVHWSGNFDEIQDFEHDIRNAFGGTGFLTDEQFSGSNPLGSTKAGLSSDLDALAAYVTSLGNEKMARSPHRSSSGLLTAQAAAGKLIFERENCASCHGGSNFSDSSGPGATLHDVGTLRTTSGNRLTQALTGIDTPTLRGIFETAPYFHDGSAKVIEDVFTVAGGTVLQAESGTVVGGAYANSDTNNVRVNFLNTVRGGGYVGMTGVGAGVRFENVDGGSGGTGAVELRYQNGYNNYSVNVRVNGVDHSASILTTRSYPAWVPINYRTVRVEGVELLPGTTNIVEVLHVDNRNLTLDEITISTRDDLAAADPHRKVPVADRDDLIAYLLQLDGNGDENGGLAAPEILSLTPIGSDSVELVWSEVRGAIDYTIYRSSTPEISSAVIVASSSTVSFTDSGLIAGSVYYYWIEAQDGILTELGGASLPVFVGSFQPDLTVGRTWRNQVGEDIYNSSMRGQFFRRDTRKYRSVYAYIYLVNDGNGSDALTLLGSRGNRNFHLTYQRFSSTVSNVSSVVRTGSYRSHNQEAGGIDRIRARIRPKRRLKTRRSSYRVSLRARSTVQSHAVDRAGFRVLRRP